MRNNISVNVHRNWQNSWFLFPGLYEQRKPEWLEIYQERVTTMPTL